ncbi:MAG TPA: dTMP kinase [Nitrospira sp.]|jgi:dTMP kinase|nr:dTMP kinase [Nitrospira sp.]
MNRTRRRSHPRGAFLTFEGPEGSGKSTQILYLTRTLRNAGYHVTATREPGGTKIAEAIRKTLLSATSHEPITAESEALLMLAARSQHVAQLIRPAVARGSVVLCDRFADSTFAYQGFGRGLSLSWLRTANEAATGGVMPDLTLLLDVPASVGLRRRGQAGGNPNRLDREALTFHQRVRRGFLSLASQARRRVKLIDADRPAEVVRAEIEALVLGWLRTRERRAGAR